MQLRVASDFDTAWAESWNGVSVAIKASHREFLPGCALYQPDLTRMVSATGPIEPKSFAPAGIFLSEFLSDLNAALALSPG